MAAQQQALQVPLGTLLHRCVNTRPCLGACVRACTTFILSTRLVMFVIHIAFRNMHYNKIKVAPLPKHHAMEANWGVYASRHAV